MSELVDLNNKPIAKGHLPQRGGVKFLLKYWKIIIAILPILIITLSVGIFCVSFYQNGLSAVFDLAITSISLSIPTIFLIISEVILLLFIFTLMTVGAYSASHYTFHLNGYLKSHKEQRGKFRLLILIDIVAFTCISVLVSLFIYYHSKLLLASLLIFSLLFLIHIKINFDCKFVKISEKRISKYRKFHAARLIVLFVYAGTLYIFIHKYEIKHIVEIISICLSVLNLGITGLVLSINDTCESLFSKGIATLGCGVSMFCLLISYVPMPVVWLNSSILGIGNGVQNASYYSTQLPQAFLMKAGFIRAPLNESSYAPNDFFITPSRKVIFIHDADFYMHTSNISIFRASPCSSFSIVISRNQPAFLTPRKVNLNDCEQYKKMYKKEIAKAIPEKLLKNFSSQNTINRSDAFLSLALAQNSSDKGKLKWYRYLLKSAQLDNPTAQYYLGQSYYLGAGIKKNLTSALYWLKKAAKNGNIAAIKVLSNWYIDVSPNLTKAYFWNTLAGLHGDRTDQRRLNILSKLLKPTQFKTIRDRFKTVV